MPEVKTGLEGELYLYNGTISWSGTVATTGSRVGFGQGVSYSWDINMIPVWDRGTFSHWKKGRGNGEMTIPQLYVANESLAGYLQGTVSGSTAPVNQAEFRVFGTAGGLEYSVQFSDCALSHYDRAEPEGDDTNTWSMTLQYMKEPGTSSGTRIG